MSDPMTELDYDDGLIAGILERTETIALVGASGNWVRPSHFAMKYLQSKGFRVIPVNPREAGAQILGETVYADLASIPDHILGATMEPKREPKCLENLFKKCAGI